MIFFLVSLPLYKITYMDTYRRTPTDKLSVRFLLIHTRIPYFPTKSLGERSQHTSAITPTCASACTCYCCLNFPLYSCSFSKDTFDFLVWGVFTEELCTKTIQNQDPILCANNKAFIFASILHHVLLTTTWVVKTHS